VFLISRGLRVVLVRAVFGCNVVGPGEVGGELHARDASTILPVSEPRAVAGATEEILPGLWYWGITDERIGGFHSSSHALRADEGVVLIDPLPLAPGALAALGPVAAICLTASVHQRSSWRLRRELGVPVWAPALSRQVEEEPDGRYSEGDVLPGGLLAIFTPGAGTTQHSLLAERDGGVLFTADLFMREPGGVLELVPAQYMHDQAEARRSAARLLELEFAVLCPGHGAPETTDAKGAIRRALEAA
jgi:glyoxylase-like metal-dependent hydrolase (beta-lactamase superfamily II)